jgi:hypothetical protein
LFQINGVCSFSENLYRAENTTLYNIERRKYETERNIIINKFQADVWKKFNRKIK